MSFKLPSFKPSDDSLKEGWVVQYDNRLWRVGLVNACRARLDPLTGTVVRADPTSGRSFRSYGDSVNVGPTSMLEPLNPELVLDGMALARFVRMEETAHAENSELVNDPTDDEDTEDGEMTRRPTAEDFSDGSIFAPAAEFEEVVYMAAGFASTPGTNRSNLKSQNKARIAKLKAKAATKAASKPKRESSGDNRCKCGCNGKTGGNFVPGHDARFKGLMLKVERGELTPEKAFPKAVIDAYSWVSSGQKNEDTGITGKRTTKNYKGEPHSGYDKSK